MLCDRAGPSSGVSWEPFGAHRQLELIVAPPRSIDHMCCGEVIRCRVGRPPRQSARLPRVAVAFALRTVATVGSRRPDRRKGRRRNQRPRDPDANGRLAGGRVTVRKGEEAWRRALLHRDAPSAEPLRALVNQAVAEGLDEVYERRLAAKLPSFGYEEAGIRPDRDIEPATAWPALEELHDRLVGNARAFVARRGSAEWLWWLRRLRGQFHVNSLDTTEPYVQLVAEVLAAGDSRPSTPLPDVPKFVFPLDAEVLLDLMWLRQAAIQLYRLHATMRRCAKGQAVRFVKDDVPYAVPDDLIEGAIDEFDQRSLKASGNLLDAVGLHLVQEPGSFPEADETFGGVVPAWWLLPCRRPGHAHLALDPKGPSPAIADFIDLRPLPPFAKTHALQGDHVALIALLWACWNIATREPAMTKARATAAFQWSYMVTPTQQFLLPALDEALTWIREHAPEVIPVDRIPHDGAAALAQLGGIKPSFFPPLPANPVHDAGEYSVVDLFGASHRLFETLVRPVDGAGVNFWSAQFEADVQRIIDASSWAPTGERRHLIGREIRRRDGTVVTDIDALAVHGDEIVFVSCKSVAHSPELSSGRHAAVRNFQAKLEAAAAEWDEKLREIDANRELLPDWAEPGFRLHGLVVAPSTPFVVDERWRRSRPPLGTPAVISSGELHEALRRR